MADESDTPVSKEQLDAAMAELEVIRAKNAELLKETKAAKAHAAKFKDVDPEKYAELVAAAEQSEREREEAKGNWQALEKQLVQKMEQERAAWTAKEQKLQDALTQHLIDAEASRALAEYSDSPALLLPHVKARMRVVEADGRLVARIVDDEGNVRIGNGKGSEPMALTELLDEMKQDKTFAPAFRGSGSSGGGAAKSSGGAGGQKVIAAGDMSAFMANVEGIAKQEVAVR